MTDRLHDAAERIAVPEGPIESGSPPRAQEPRRDEQAAVPQDPTGNSPANQPEEPGPGDPRLDRDPGETPPADEISHPG
jgi:hypothetical protein